jgi:WD40 repeat protein
LFALDLLRGEHRAVNRAAFSPDGARVLTTSGTTARLWELRPPLSQGRSGPGAAWRELARLAHDARVMSAAFSPDGARVLTTSESGSPRLWDATTGAEFARLAHDGEVWSAAFSPDGARVVTAAIDHTARLWDAATGLELVRLAHDDRVMSAAFSRDGARVATASEDRGQR